MLVLRLLVMVLTIICLMDGHAEVSSSTTGIRDRRESPAVKTNEQEVEILDRKKKKKPKPGKKKKTKPGKKKKPNKAKPTPTEPVTTTPTVSTSTLKTTTILTTPTVTTTVTTTTTTVSPTTTATTTKTTTSTASATTTLSTTTSAATTTTTTTTTVATSSTASTTTTTIPTTATTSSLPTTAATTADSGAGEECKATNGKPCIFPFKDGKEYNECKNEGGKYFWCATSVYDSGKYKHWSYCPEDRSCPLEGDGECRAENNKPCVFPFKDGEKEYNECADHGGQYFWCATGTNSAGKYTAWSKCPKDGSCPLPQKSSTPVITPTATAAITSPLTTGTTMPPMEKKVFSSLKDLVKEESKNDTFKMLQTMNEEMQAINEDLEGQRNIESDHGSGGNETILKKHSVGDGQDGDLIELRSYGENSEFTWSTFTYKGPTYLMGESNCCSACKKKWPETLFFEYWAYFKKCWCYKEGSYGEPGIKHHNSISTGKCEGTCVSTRVLDCPIWFVPQNGPKELYIIGHIEITQLPHKQLCAKTCLDHPRCTAIWFNMECEHTQNRCLLLSDNDPGTGIKAGFPNYCVTYLRCPHPDFIRKHVCPDCQNIRDCVGHIRKVIQSGSLNRGPNAELDQHVFQYSDTYGHNQWFLDTVNLHHDNKLGIMIPICKMVNPAQYVGKVTVKRYNGIATIHEFEDGEAAVRRCFHYTTQGGHFDPNWNCNYP